MSTATIETLSTDECAGDDVKPPLVGSDRRLTMPGALLVGVVSMSLLLGATFGVVQFLDYSQKYATGAAEASHMGEQVQVLAVVAAKASSPGADLVTIRGIGMKAGLDVAASVERFRHRGLEPEDLGPLQQRLNEYFAALAKADVLFKAGDLGPARQAAAHAGELVTPISAITRQMTGDLERSARQTARLARIGSVVLLMVAVATVGGLLVFVGRRQRRAAVVSATEAAKLSAATALADLNHMLRAVTAADSALVHATEETSLLEDMCRVIVEAGGYPRAWIAGPDREHPGQVIPIASYGDGGTFHKAVTSSNGTPVGPVGLAVERGETQVVKDIVGLPEHLVVRKVALDHGYRSLVAVPIRVDGCIYGALVVYADRPEAFDADAVSLLEDLARNLGYGIGALRSRAERLVYLRRLERKFGSMIGVVATTVELRDPYTAGHQRGVARLAAAIALEMGLDADTIEGIEVAAGIHDVGKVAIPAEILSKPTRLTGLEFELIKQHPQAGYDIVRTIDFPWPVAEMILQHHERMDGSGYPAGLVGEDILLGARVIAVADTVEAMAAHRPYRPSKGIGVALRQIETDRGIRLDATAVDACLRLFETQRFSLDADPAELLASPAR